MRFLLFISLMMSSFSSFSYSNEELIELIKEGGYVLMIRHTSRGSLEGDTLVRADRFSHCITGSSLSVRGVEEAKRMGERFRSNNIPISEFLSSPSCRCRQLMYYAFPGKFYEIKAEILYKYAKSAEENDRMKPILNYHFSHPIALAGTNRVISGHNNTIESLEITGMPPKPLGMGDVAVIRPMGNSNFEFVGTISRFF